MMMTVACCRFKQVDLMMINEPTFSLQMNNILFPAFFITLVTETNWGPCAIKLVSRIYTLDFSCLQDY